MEEGRRRREISDLSDHLDGVPRVNKEIIRGRTGWEVWRQGIKRHTTVLKVLLNLRYRQDIRVGRSSR